jgi:hypothetical protein
MGGCGHILFEKIVEYLFFIAVVTKKGSYE